MGPGSAPSPAARQPISPPAPHRSSGSTGAALDAGTALRSNPTPPQAMFAHLALGVEPHYQPAGFWRAFKDYDGQPVNIR